MFFVIFKSKRHLTSWFLSCFDLVEEMGLAVKEVDL